jgi:hypothetical protein
LFRYAAEVLNSTIIVVGTWVFKNRWNKVHRHNKDADIIGV